MVFPIAMLQQNYSNYNNSSYWLITYGFPLVSPSPGAPLQGEESPGGAVRRARPGGLPTRRLVEGRRRGVATPGDAWRREKGWMTGMTAMKNGVFMGFSWDFHGIFMGFYGILWDFMGFMRIF